MVGKQLQTDSSCGLMDTKLKVIFECIKGKHSVINSSSNLVQTTLEAYFDVHTAKIYEEQWDGFKEEHQGVNQLLKNSPGSKPFFQKEDKELEFNRL